MAFFPIGTTPLKRWRLRNFKSVLEAELELAPLTVIAGENSSGKSSIIQSVLLLAQAFRQPSTDAAEALPLNGELVILGGIEDVRSLFADAGAPVRIGATFDLGSQRRPVPSSIRRVGHIERRPVRRSDIRVDWDVSLSGSTANRPGATDVQRNEVHIDAGEIEVFVDLLRRDRPPAEDRRAFEVGQTMVPSRGNFSLNYEGKIGQSLVDDEPTEVFGALTRGVFPAAVLVRDNDVDLFAREWWDAHVARRSVQYRSIPPRGVRDRERESLWPETPEDRLTRLVDLASEELERLRSLDAEDAAATSSVGRRLSRSAAELLSDPEIHGRFPEFVESLRARTQGTRDVLTPAHETWSYVLDDAAGALRRLLAEQTSYLGPLRQDPQIQERTAVATAADLGTKGQLTAATLYAQRDRVILCPELEGEPQPRRLGAAVAQWAAYLGIAEEVSPIDLGRPGIELRVRPHDLKREVDLTAVGVGVSQLLPVLVLCLLAEPGGIVLLEQPELHLHPALQQRLGDFLLACARSGRQLIVETHSEHLISRLRLRAAKDETDEVVNLFTVIFVELEGGVTQIRSVRTNRFGGIEEWPRGFFDQGVRESREILEQGLRKKQEQASEQT